VRTRTLDSGEWLSNSRQRSRRQSAKAMATRAARTALDAEGLAALSAAHPGPKPPVEIILPENPLKSSPMLVLPYNCQNCAFCKAEGVPEIIKNCFIFYFFFQSLLNLTN